ncbi:hypothetical protein GmHk_14G041719 [Glycine max]|nr:hypothetical protein GmHk_14G041719 [Glycine max]
MLQVFIEASALTYLYEHLTSVSFAGTKQIGGYATLETFPCISRWSNKSSLVVIYYRELIDELTIKGVRWTPHEMHSTHHPFENISLFSRYIHLGLDLHLCLPERVLCQ